METNLCGSRPIDEIWADVFLGRPISRAEAGMVWADVSLCPPPKLKRALMERIVFDPGFPDFLRENIRLHSEKVIQKNLGLMEFLLALSRFEDIQREEELRELPPDVREKIRSMIPPAKSRPKKRGRPRKKRAADVRNACLALRAFGYSEREAAKYIGERLCITPEAVRSIVKKEKKSEILQIAEFAVSTRGEEITMSERENTD